MPEQEIEEQEELVDLWDGVEYEEELDNPTDEELEEDEDEELEEEDSDEEDEEEGDEIDPDIELEDEDIEEEEDEGEDDDEDDSDSDDVPLVKLIQDQLGFEFDEEFEDTEEGIQRLVEESAKKLADQQIDVIFSEYPEVQELFEYRELGGDPDKFFETKFPEVDFEKVEFDEEDSQQHEMLVRRELAERGYSQEEINAEIEDYKNGGILESKAQRALSTLEAKQKEAQEKLLDQQKEEFRETQEAIEDYWEDIKETIDNSTTFKNFKIPSQDKEEFFNYLSKPVEDGKSQRDLDVEEADRETRLAIDYLLYKGFNIADIIDRKAKDKNAKTLRERMKQRKLERKRKKQQKSDPNVELGTI